MLGRVPLVHPIHNFLWLVNRQHRALRYFVQMKVSHDCCDFDDLIRDRIQTGHFQIDPDQIARCVTCRRILVRSHAFPYPYSAAA